MTTVVLVRHGETTWNRDGRVQGWAPSTLTDRGHEQAKAVADHLGTNYAVDRVVASDLRRTVETARYVRRTVDAPVTYDRDWRERDFGVLQGLHYDELFEGYPEFALTKTGIVAAHARPEGGESWLDMRDRIEGAWRDLLDDAREGETVAVVTHGGPTRTIIALLEGLDVVSTLTALSLDNCSLTEVRVHRDGDVLDPVLVRQNETGFLGADGAESAGLE